MRAILEQKKSAPAPQAQQPEPDDVASLRDMLEDFLLLGEHLFPLCDDFQHALAVVRGGLNSNDQLKFLANVLKRAAKS